MHQVVFSYKPKTMSLFKFINRKDESIYGEKAITFLGSLHILVKYDKQLEYKPQH